MGKFVWFSMRKYSTKNYTLTDGSVVTIQDIMLATNLSYTGAVGRLRQSKDPLFIFADKSKRGIHLNRVKVIEPWVDKPTKVCGGIPYECSYLDGTIDVNGNVVDRNGKVLSKNERDSLEKFRCDSRQEWRVMRRLMIDDLIQGE